MQALTADRLGPSRVKLLYSCCGNIHSDWDTQDTVQVSPDPRIWCHLYAQRSLLSSTHLVYSCTLEHAHLLQPQHHGMLRLGHNCSYMLPCLTTGPWEVLGFSDWGDIWASCATLPLLDLDTGVPFMPPEARRALSRSRPIRGCLEPEASLSSIFCWLTFCSACRHA